MEKTLPEMLKQTADVLHFFGKYSDANKLIDLSVWLLENNILSIGDLPQHQQGE